MHCVLPCVSCATRAIEPKVEASRLNVIMHACVRACVRGLHEVPALSLAAHVHIHINDTLVIKIIGVNLSIARASKINKYIPLSSGYLCIINTYLVKTLGTINSTANSNVLLNDIKYPNYLQSTMLPQELTSSPQSTANTSIHTNINGRAKSCLSASPSIAPGSWKSARRITIMIMNSVRRWVRGRGGSKE